MSKNCAKLFISELRHIFTNFDNSWQKDVKESKIMQDAFISTSHNFRHYTTVLNAYVPNWQETWSRICGLTGITVQGLIMIWMMMMIINEQSWKQTVDELYQLYLGYSVVIRCSYSGPVAVGRVAVCGDVVAMATSQGPAASTSSHCSQSHVQTQHTPRRHCPVQSSDRRQTCQ